MVPMTEGDGMVVVVGTGIAEGEKRSAQNFDD